MSSLLFLNINERRCVSAMLKRLKDKLKKRWKDFLGQERVPTTYKKDYHNHSSTNHTNK
jgi:hypothetical protein